MRLTGRLEFHSETGTEGGYWAFFDTRFQHDAEHPCGSSLCPCLMREETDRPGWFSLHGTGRRSSEIHTSYDGLHVLHDGDQLRIFDNAPGELIWHGTIALIKYPLFTEDAGGLWIHADQQGVDRNVWAWWFFDRLPAELETTDDFPRTDPDKIWS